MEDGARVLIAIDAGNTKKLIKIIYNDVDCLTQKGIIF